MAPIPIINTKLPNVSPIPFCMDVITLFAGIPRASPPKMEIIKNDKTGLILKTEIRMIKHNRQISTINISIIF